MQLFDSDKNMLLCARLYIVSRGAASKLRILSLVHSVYRVLQSFKSRHVRVPRCTSFNLIHRCAGLQQYCNRTARLWTRVQREAFARVHGQNVRHQGCRL